MRDEGLSRVAVNTAITTRRLDHRIEIKFGEFSCVSIQFFNLSVHHRSSISDCPTDLFKGIRDEINARCTPQPAKFCSPARGPTETRNGQQLRRGDAHIATKARIAGHPSFSFSLPLSTSFLHRGRGRIATAVVVTATAAPFSIIRRGASRGRALWQRVGFYEWMSDLYGAPPRRCVFSVPKRQGRFARRKAGNGDSILPRGASEEMVAEVRKQRGWLSVTITAAPRVHWRGNTIVTLDENDRCDFTLRKEELYVHIGNILLSLSNEALDALPGTRYWRNTDIMRIHINASIYFSTDSIDVKLENFNHCPVFDEHLLSWNSWNSNWEFDLSRRC